MGSNRGHIAARQEGRVYNIEERGHEEQEHRSTARTGCTLKQDCIILAALVIESWRERILLPEQVHRVEW